MKIQIQKAAEDCLKFYLDFLFWLIVIFLWYLYCLAWVFHLFFIKLPLYIIGCLFSCFKCKRKPTIANQNAYRDKRPGIPNYGNTCYLNSIIQVLFSTPEFANSIKCCFGLSDIFDDMRSSNHNFEPKIKNFLLRLSKEYQIFSFGNQNDCKELYNVLIEKLAKENSDAENFFRIIKCQKIVCSMNHSIEKTEDSYFLLYQKSFNSSLSSYLKYLKDETIEFNEDNALLCEKCHCLRTTIIKTTSLKLPKIFAVYNSGKTFKDIASVASINFEGKSYELYGVIRYFEHEHLSHYTACTLDKDGKWREYNDNYAIETYLDMENAYMLFYRLESK